MPRSSSRETIGRQPRPAPAPVRTLFVAASLAVAVVAFLLAAVFSGLPLGVPEAFAHRPTYQTWPSRPAAAGSSGAASAGAAAACSARRQPQPQEPPARPAERVACLY